MNKLIIEGIIETGYRDGWTAIFIRQADGYKIDLIGRFIELNYNAGNIQVNYYLADERLDEISLKEAIILKLSGGVYADYDKYEVRYSSWTSDTNYTQELKVGGHNLYNELICEARRFVRFEINYIPL